MSSFTITIDGRPVEVNPGQTVLQAARELGLDIPTLCYLEKCGPLNSCLVCLVRINGRMVPSCGTRAEPGMVVESESETVHAARRTALELLFSDHVGDCLSPCNLLCPLLMNIPVMIRQIETGQLKAAAATVRQALPLAAVLGRLCHHPCEKGCRRGAHDDPAAIREMERFVADEDLQSETPYRLPCKPPTGRRVAVVGAGPAGLSAAYFLVRDGHAVEVFDRHEHPGGTLHGCVARGELPREALEGEVARLRDLGIRFHGSSELGRDITLDRLAGQFAAVVLTVGSTAINEAEGLGVRLVEAGIKADPNTCRTELPNVFAAGAAVKPIKQIVRAMSEGRMVAECVSQFLAGRDVRRSDKPFSSLMGRLDPGELKTFLQTSSLGPRVSPCAACAAGLSRRDAAGEASRCLHCDCRSSGNCVLQHYGQVYGADAGRFRSKRRGYEQQLQPGGVVFEPGKCILCGICVKLTEQAREPLGLTFIGRGFDVRIGTPLDRSIDEGLQKVAEEVVHHCPTGALCFAKDGAEHLPHGTECGR
ncbi:MAG: (2Fe-2S)-binding protein [Verrucomicrobia bacterium]|nr:(2Fe-2S)-binding protein [Verrucomicrobiota bacterium]